MNNYYLLQTDNYDPLIQLVQQLCQRVDENEKIITQILQDVDTLKLPKYDLDVDKLLSSSDETKETTTLPVTAEIQGFPAAKEEDFDDVKHFLNTKYHLDDMEEPFKDVDPPVQPEGMDSEDAQKVQGLLSDIRKLTAIKAQTMEVNRQLYEVIQTYQSFITGTLVPQLRSDFNSTLLQQNKEFEKLMDMKMEVSSKVYGKYQLYLNYLNRLLQMFRILADALAKLGSDEVLKVETRLVAIQEVVNSLHAVGTV